MIAPAGASRAPRAPIPAAAMALRLPAPGGPPSPPGRNSVWLTPDLKLLVGFLHGFGGAAAGGFTASVKDKVLPLLHLLWVLDGTGYQGRLTGTSAQQRYTRAMREGAEWKP